MNFKNKKIPAILICAACLLIAGAGYLTFGGKSARKFYLDAEARNFKKYSAHLNEMYAGFYGSQLPYLQGRYKRRLEVTADVGQESQGIAAITGMQGIAGVLNKSKLVIDAKNDPMKNMTSTAVSLLIEKTPLIDASLFTRDKTLGFSVPVLAPDKYFTVDMDRFDEVYGRFGIPVRPKRIVTAADAARIIKYDPEAVEAVSREYGLLISSLIDEKAVRFGGKVDLAVGGKQVRAREIIVTLDGSASSQLLKKLSGKASEDESLMGLTIGNLAGLLGLAGDTGLLQLEQYIEDSGMLKLNDVLKGAVSKLGSNIDLAAVKQRLASLGNAASLPDGIRMTVLTDGAGNILDRKVKFTAASGGASKADGASGSTGGVSGSTGAASGNMGTASCVVEIHTGANSLKDDDFSNSFVSLSISSPGSDAKLSGDAFTVNTAFSPKAANGDRNGKISLGYEKTTGGARSFAAAADFDILEATDSATLKKTRTVKYDIRFNSGSPEITDRFYGEVSTGVSENKKQKTRSYNTAAGLNLDLKSFDMPPASIKLNIAGEDRFDIPEFRLPEQEISKALSLNTASDAEIRKAEEEMLASFGSFYLSNKSLFDAVTGSK